MKENPNLIDDTIPAEAHVVLDELAQDQKRFKRNVNLALFVLNCLLVLFLIVLGLDFRFMARWLGFILTGLGYTILVSVLAISLACVLALVGALGRLSHNPVVNAIAISYVSLVRGTPLLVQVYMWYLALPQVGQALERLGIAGAQRIFTLPAVPAGVLALGFCYGAYMTEIVRAGIESIKFGQIEAAKSLGMTESQTMRRIVLPQALRIIIPPISNEFIAMVKDSSLVSLMGVWELSYRAIKIGRRYFQSLEMLILAALIYWFITILLQTVQERIERHMARGETRRRKI